jgi:hypothetical protein
VIGALKWLVIAVALLILPAAMCNPEPVVPTPSAGGSVATGGAPAAGGVSYGGASPPVGGTSSEGGSVAAGGVMPSTVAEAIIWPECPKQAKRLDPGAVERYRRTLGRRHEGPIVARPKASYQLLDLPNVFWRPSGPALDQLNLGSCTGNFGVNVRLSTLWARPNSWPLDALGLEAVAVDIYGAATRIDPWKGAWPPDDTGSNSASVLTIMRNRGLVSGWTTVQSFDGFQRQMQKGPCGFGSNWYSSMYAVKPGGNIEISGTVDGGHQYTARAIDYRTKRVMFDNSWGNDFGCELNGRGGLFYLTFGSVQRLINEGADIDCPIVD